MMKPQIIKSKNSAGEEVTLVIKPPRRSQHTDAQCYASSVLRQAMKANVPTREQLKDYMIEQGFWSKEKEQELEDIEKKIVEGEEQLSRGGITKTGAPFTKKDARELAINMRIWRAERLILLSKYAELDEYSLESQAENARFDHLVSSCVFDEEGNRVFESIDDYLDKAEEDYAAEAAAYLSTIVQGLEPDFIEKRPENEFLVKYGFAREEDGRLVNNEGQLVDVKGNVIENEEEEKAEFVEFPE